MSTPTLTGQSVYSVNVRFNPGTLGAVISPNLNAGQSGSNGAVVPNVPFLYGASPGIDSSGNLLVSQFYCWIGSIAGSGSKSIALNGGADADVDGVTLAYTTLTWFLVAVLYPAGGSAPDGVNYLKVGPQNLTNAWDGAWGGGGSTVYETCYFRKEWVGPAAGATVNSSDLFKVTNPGSTAITTLIALLGGG